MLCWFVSWPNKAAGEDDESLSLTYSVDEELPRSFATFVRGGFGATRPAEADTGIPSPFYARYEEGLRPNSFEFLKQHVLSGDARANTWSTGWRFDAFVDDASVGAGQEAIASDDRQTVWSELRSRSLFRGLRGVTYAAGGLRINDFQSSLDWSSTNTILGRTGAVVENNHLAVGPQVSLGAVTHNSIWRFEAVALSFLGYQHTDYELNGLVGQEIIPGSINQPIDGRTFTTSIVGPNEDDFAWGFETRLTAGAQLTKHWRFDTTWRWAVVGPIYDASRSMAYTVPYFTLTPSSGDDEYLSDLFLGLTYVR